MDQRQSNNLERQPTSDQLGFEPYVKRIVNTIRDANQLPLTIGVYGRWGSGKTYLMKMVEERLTSAEAHKQRERREWGKHTVPWLAVSCACWGVLFIVGLIVAGRVSRFMANMAEMQQNIMLIGWLAVCFSAFGGLARAIFETWRHAAIESEGRLPTGQEVTWLELLPFVSIAIGGFPIVILFMILSAWLPEMNVGPVASILVYLLAFMAGAIWYRSRFAWRMVGRWTVTAVAKVLARLTGRQRQQGSWAAQAVQTTPASSSQQTSLPVQTQARFQVIWFNAWKFAQQDQLWAALLQQVLSQLQINAYGWRGIGIKWRLWKRSIAWTTGARDILLKILPTLGKALFVAASGVAAAWLANLAVSPAAGAEVGQAAGTAAGLLTTLASVSSFVRTNISQPLASLDFEKYRKKATYKDHITFLSQFNEEFTRITRIARDGLNPIVLMLDDLDRCLPEQAVSVLEAIKLFVGDEAPLVFVIGADREIIERAIDVKYAGMINREDEDEGRRERFAQYGHEYLEKIVDLPFNLPPIEDERVEDFIEAKFPDDAVVKNNSHIFIAGLMPNPRQILRVVAIYRFVLGLADDKGQLYSGDIDGSVLAMLVIIQYRWPSLYADLVENKGLLAALQATFQASLNKSSAVSDPTTVTPLPPAADPNSDLAELVEKYKPNQELRYLLTVANGPLLDGVDLRSYLFFTARAQSQATSPPLASSSSAPEGMASTPAEGFGPDDLKSAFDRLDDQIQKLTAGGADSAVIARLMDGSDRVRKALDSNDLTTAQTLLAEFEPHAASAVSGLEAQGGKRSQQRVIEAQVSRRGELMFQRAMTYMPLGIRVDGDPYEEVRISVRRYPTSPWVSTLVGPSGSLGPDFWASVHRFYEASASQGELNSLGLRLGQLVQSILVLGSVNPDGRSIRFEVTSEQSSEHEIPWELAQLSPLDLPLGCDPHHSLVRRVEVTVPALPARSSRTLTILIAAATPSDNPLADYHILVDRMKEALSPLVKRRAIKLHILEDATNDKLRKDLLQLQPNIFHLIASTKIDERGRAFVLLEDKDKGSDQVPVALLSMLLRESGTAAVTLDGKGSSFAARELAARGLPAVVGWQSLCTNTMRVAFGLSYYQALLRTGQADFAITEGRRAIATDTPSGAYDAVSPVLYLHATEEATIFSGYDARVLKSSAQSAPR